MATDAFSVNHFQGGVLRMKLVGEVKRLPDEQLDPKPDGYNVGFNAGDATGPVQAL